MAEENKNTAEQTSDDMKNTQEAAAEDTQKTENRESGSAGEGQKPEEAQKGMESAAQEEKADQEEASQETPVKEEKERKFFGKKKEKKDKKDERIDELTDQLKRQMAEFDNFRKRTEKEKASMYVIGAKEIVEKMLPIVDNFERGLATVQESEDPFVQGMEKIYKQLMTAFDEMGVKAIEAVGQEFNPDLHNAVMHVEDENAGENIVVEEFQKGYTYKDFVVRHSMVKVAN